jgi:hypothetical protein
VDGSGTSLLSVIETAHSHLVLVAFDLMRSDLPVRVAFPVLMNNLLRWLAPPQEELASGQIQAGMAHAVFFDPPVSRVTVQDPAGKNRDYTVQGNPWVFAETDQIGVYILRAGEQKRYLTVNLLDEAESDISPAAQLPTSTSTAETTTLHQAGLAQTPLWPYLLFGAVLVLVGEWYLWCQDL